MWTSSGMSMLVIESLKNLWTPVLMEEGEQVRSISNFVFTHRLNVESMHENQIELWSEAVSQQHFTDAGEIIALNGSGLLPPMLNFQVLSWMGALGLSPQQVDANALACRGAFFHHDAEHFSNSVFAVVWLDEQDNSDLLLPAMGKRIPLKYGTVVLFDPCQPHGVVARGKNKFVEADFHDTDIAAFACFDIDAADKSIATAMEIRFRDDLNDIENAVLVGGFENQVKDKVEAHTGQWKLDQKSVGFKAKANHKNYKKEKILAA